LLGWLTPAQFGGGLATAAVLGIAVSFGLNQSRQPPVEFWSDWQSPKSLETQQTGNSQVADLQSFLVGMGQQMRALSIPAVDPAGQDFPDQVTSCLAADESCTLRRQLLSELGQLAVLSKLECMVGDSDESARQQRVPQILGELESDDNAAMLVAPLRRWASADAVSERCSAVSQLISRGLVANTTADK
jgi:hypothetical protein